VNEAPVISSRESKVRPKKKVNKRVEEEVVILPSRN
jgi:hypothetical protein